MNPVVAALITSAITVLSRWSRGNQVSIDVVVGLAGIAIGLSILEQVNSKFARAMGVLIVVGTLVAQGPTLFDAIGKVTGNDSASGRSNKRRPTLSI
jgi:hypothetical protein